MQNILKLCLASAVHCQQTFGDWAVHSPPTEGRFFYTDLKNGNIEARVSAEEEVFSLKLNTWTSGMQMFSQKYSRQVCQVPKYYDEELFKSSVNTNATFIEN